MLRLESFGRRSLRRWARELVERVTAVGEEELRDADEREYQEWFRR